MSDPSTLSPEDLPGILPPWRRATEGCQAEVDERPIVFEHAGQRLFGVMAAPALRPQAETALLTLHGWSGYRIGPHGIFVALARRAAAEGYPSLRFDFRGRGDSDGDPAEANRASMVADALRAAEVLRERTGCRRLVFVGLCAGCQVALGAAAQAPPDGLVLWSAPVSEQAEEEKASASKRRHFAGEYARKLLRAQTWRKLITGRLQPRRILQVMSGTAGRAAVDDRQVDLKAAAALAGYGGQILFVYGTGDPVMAVALPYYQRILARRERQVSVATIENANHSFYGTAWREELLEVTLAWLRAHFPSS